VGITVYASVTDELCKIRSQQVQAMRQMLAPLSRRATRGARERDEAADRRERADAAERREREAAAERKAEAERRDSQTRTHIAPHAILMLYIRPGARVNTALLSEPACSLSAASRSAVPPGKPPAVGHARPPGRPFLSLAEVAAHVQDVPRHLNHLGALLAQQIHAKSAVREIVGNNRLFGGAERAAVVARSIGVRLGSQLS